MHAGAISTTNIPVAGSPASSFAFVAKWNEALLGIRSDLTIRAANHGVVGSLNLTESHAVVIVAAGRFDFAVLRPAAFCAKSPLK